MTEPSDKSEAVSQDLTGQAVDKYKITKPIGKGAMGQVYEAHDTVLDRHVALKVMAAQIADDLELKARFEREAQAVAKMMHPNVVAVFDLGSLDDGSPYIAMELLQGLDLQKTVRRNPAMTLERKVQIIIQVLTGLNVAHQKGIVHRDIKPANIFIQKDDTVKIMDFGVARLTTASMTGTGNIVGTADYMSPEQVKGAKVDGRSDLFSVGCLLFELVTGRRPFHSDNLMAIFYKITHDVANFDLFPAGAEHDALLPILKKALAKEIAERYQTAYDFAVDLREWLRAHGTSASTQHVLESLVGLEAPTHAPQPLVDAPGAPPDGTVDLGDHQPGGPRRATTGPTQISGRTVLDGRPGVAARPTTRPSRPPAMARRRGRRPQRRSPLPGVALAVVTAAAVGGGAYYYFVHQKGEATQPVAQVAPPPATPAPAPTAEATPTPPPATPAPQPTFAPPEGRAGASVRAANTAFDRGQYDRAVANAQKALSEDPENATARQILDKAEKGQQAAVRVQAGESALASGDHEVAAREAEAARALAPWDTSVADLRRRIDAAKLDAQRAAQTQAEQQQAARINELLNQGATALSGKQYDAAIAAYDQVLQLDPGNTAAQTGKTGAITARSVAEAAAGGGGPTTRPAAGFVAGTSVAEASQADSGSTPPGFETTPEVEVQRGSQAAALPGRLVIEASPAAPKAGDSFRVSAYLMNQGSQPIELDRMMVTTVIDGRKNQGPVAPRASVVAPRQRALVFQLRPQQWKQETQGWEMEIVVYTSKRETYRNTLTWK